MDYWLGGSVLAGTVDAGVTELRSHFEVESDESEEDILFIIGLAKRGCFAEKLVSTAVPIVSSVKFNGKDVSSEIEDA